MNLKKYLKDDSRIHKNSFMLDDIFDAVKAKRKEQKEKKSISKDLRRFKQ